MLDDETKVSKWLPAKVMSRVVDSDGKDSYLAAEYSWDDEFYVQDFDPQHVRERGRQQTVLQLFLLEGQRKQEMDSTKVFSKASRPDAGAKQEMDSTKVFGKPSRPDAGAKQDMDSTKAFAKPSRPYAGAATIRDEMDGTKVFAKQPKTGTAQIHGELDSTKVFRK